MNCNCALNTLKLDYYDFCKHWWVCEELLSAPKKKTILCLGGRFVVCSINKRKSDIELGMCIVIKLKLLCVRAEFYISLNRNFSIYLKCVLKMFRLHCNCFKYEICSTYTKCTTTSFLDKTLHFTNTNYKYSLSAFFKCRKLKPTKKNEISNQKWSC